jgi:hypothetical protein
MDRVQKPNNSEGNLEMFRARLYTEQNMCRFNMKPNQRKCHNRWTRMLILNFIQVISFLFISVTLSYFSFNLKLGIPEGF